MKIFVFEVFGDVVWRKKVVLWFRLNRIKCIIIAFIGYRQCSCSSNTLIIWMIINPWKRISIESRSYLSTMDMGDTRPIIFIDHHTLHPIHNIWCGIVIGSLGMCFSHQLAILPSFIDIAFIEAAIKGSIVVIGNNWDEFCVKFIHPYYIDMMISIISGYIEQWSWGTADLSWLLAGLVESSSLTAVV